MFLPQITFPFFGESLDLLEQCVTIVLTTMLHYEAVEGTPITQ
jgi:hypothetical protein